MTIRPRAVRALRDIRERLRDEAAASHATAVGHADAAGVAVSESHDQLEAFLDDASQALGEVTSVYDIDRISDHAGDYRVAIVDATARHKQAVAITEVTAGNLRERARQLRTAEKLVELVDDHRARRDAKAEQLGNDDMASGRKR